uniref:Uncharacterized protein n=1 Tax=Triticum urartu TaxID=4572 RepID=A0A8R7Q237_TRIUA
RCPRATPHEIPSPLPSPSQPPPIPSPIFLPQTLTRLAVRHRPSRPPPPPPAAAAAPAPAVAVAPRSSRGRRPHFPPRPLPCAPTTPSPAAAPQVPPWPRHGACRHGLRAPPMTACLAHVQIYKRSRRVMFWMLILTNSCRMNYAMTAWMSFVCSSHLPGGPSPTGWR